MNALYSALGYAPLTAKGFPRKLVILFTHLVDFEGRLTLLSHYRTPKENESFDNLVLSDIA